MLNSIEQKIGDLFSLDQLDCKAGYSELEELTAQYLFDQYGEMDESFIREHGEQVQIKAEEFYHLLSGKKAATQTVYIDLSQFEYVYEAKGLSTYTHKTWRQWKREFRQGLEKKYTDSQGNQLRIQFTFDRPVDGKYTTLSFLHSNQPYKILEHHPAATQIYFVKSLLRTGYASVVQAAKDLKENNPEKSNQEILLALFHHESVKNFKFASHANGQCFHQFDGLDLGNRDSSEIVMVYTNKIFDEDFSEIWTDVFKTRSDLVTDHLVSAAAHEIGHALGLKHPGTLERRARKLDKLDNTEMCVEEKALMCQSKYYAQNYKRGEAPIFSDFQMSYLKHVLGVTE